MKRTPEFVEKVRHMYLRQGLPQAVIARRLGCDPGTVRLALRRGPIDRVQYAKTRIPGAIAGNRAKNEKLKRRKRK